VFLIFGCSDEQSCQLCQAPSESQGGPYHSKDDGQVQWVPVKVVGESGFVGSKQKFLGQSTGVPFLCIWVCLACDEEHEWVFFCASGGALSL